MNALDRKNVEKIASELDDLKEKLSEIGGRLRDLADAEQEKFDNMSDGLQGSERGQAIESAASALGSAADSAENGELEGAISALAEVEL